MTMWSITKTLASIVASLLFKDFWVSCACVHLHLNMLFFCILESGLHIKHLDWLRHRPLPERRAALLYGRPALTGVTKLQVDDEEGDDDGTIMIMINQFDHFVTQVVVTDRHTFKTGLLDVEINVEEANNENFEVISMINMVHSS